MTSQLGTVAYYTNTSYFYIAKNFMTFIYAFLVITDICLHYFIWLGADSSIYSKEEKHAVPCGSVSLQTL